MLSPRARGSLSEYVLDALRSGATSQLANAPEPDSTEDAQLALWVMYELHHRGFDDVADELEWDPNLIAARRQLELEFEQTLRDRTPELPNREHLRRRSSTSSPTMRVHPCRLICTGLRAQNRFTSFYDTSRFII